MQRLEQQFIDDTEELFNSLQREPSSKETAEAWQLTDSEVSKMLEEKNFNYNIIAVEKNWPIL